MVTFTVLRRCARSEAERLLRDDTVYLRAILATVAGLAGSLAVAILAQSISFSLASASGLVFMIYVARRTAGALYDRRLVLATRPEMHSITSVARLAELALAPRSRRHVAQLLTKLAGIARHYASRDKTQNEIRRILLVAPALEKLSGVLRRSSALAPEHAAACRLLARWSTANPIFDVALSDGDLIRHVNDLLERMRAADSAVAKATG